MVKKLKCLRCDNEYDAPSPEEPEVVERTCPKCRSNSVRLISEEKRSSD